MDVGFANALNPFQQDFTEAEDFINILRQANAPFSWFDGPLINELLPLQQVADSWVQLSLQSFAPAAAGFGDLHLAATGADASSSSITASTAQNFGATGAGETQGVPAPYGTLLNLSGSGGGSSSGSGGLPGGDSPYGTLLNPVPSGGDLSAWTGTSYGMILPVSPGVTL